MNRCILIMVCTILLAQANPHLATAFDLYGFASFWNTEDSDSTWGAGMGLSLPLFSDHLCLDGRITGYADSDMATHDKLTLVPVDLGLQFHLFPGNALAPYVLGGISYIYADADKTDIDSGFGEYLGLGLEMELGLPFIRLFGEGIYRFSDLDQPTAEDISVNGLSANIGLKVHF